MKILVIEDEPQMLDLIKQFLNEENFTVETASDFSTGIDKICSYDYDCILLDIMLPDGNGLTILKRLKELGKSDSVIIISARDSIDDKVKGLNLGADDYLAKPFHISELNARIRSVLRRKTTDGSRLIEINNLAIDAEQRVITVGSMQLSLNRKEFDILLYLALNKNRITGKSALAENIWGDNIDQANDFDFIYSQIKNLRKKLISSGAEVDLVSIYGIGYKLVAK
jgi:DNA-binding response OmpR family regulator